MKDRPIRYLLENILEFQTSQGRRVVKYVRRPLDEERILEICASFGFELALLDEWLELYRCFDGVDPGDQLSLSAGAVFLDWPWESLKAVKSMRANVLARAEPGEEQQLYFGMGFGVPWIGLDFSRTRDGIVPVFIGRPRRPRPIAFDSLEAMLRAIVAAQERGLITYDSSERIVYDRVAVARLVRESNCRDEYWRQFL